MNALSSASFDETVEHILAASNKRRQQTIKAFVGVLEDLRARGVQVFNIATVGLECEARKLLRTQYMRNSNGEPYRRLIEAFSRQHNLKATREPVRRLSPMDEAIASIPDLDVRTRLLSLIDENKALRAQVQRLETGFKHLTVQAPASQPQLVEAAPQVEAEILPPAPRVSLNLGPIERFVSEDWLDQNAWTVSEAGTILDGPNSITPPGFVPAVKAALGALREKVILER